MSCTGAWRQGFCRYHQPEECQRPGVSGIIHSARQLFVSLVPPFSLAKEQMNRPCNQYSHQCTLETRGFLTHKWDWGEEVKRETSGVHVRSFACANPIWSHYWGSSQTASDWVGAFKGPNMCTWRFSHVRLGLFTSSSFVSEKTAGFQCITDMRLNLIFGN